MNIICKLQNVSCLFYFSYAVSVVAVNSAVGITVSVASAVFRGRIPTTVSVDQAAVDQAAVAAAVVTNSLEYLIAAEPAVVAAQPEVVAFADHVVEAAAVGAEAAAVAGAAVGADVEALAIEAAVGGNLKLLLWRYSRGKLLLWRQIY